MDVDVSRRVHIAPFGVERDRIVVPVIEYAADRVVLLDYLQDRVAGPSVEELEETFDANGVACETRDIAVDDPLDALAAVGQAAVDHADDEVFVNLATGDKRVAVGSMVACMATHARPYYVSAQQYGSHEGPVPKGVRSIDSMPSYPIEQPEDQQLRVLQYIANSDRTTADGEPYRIKRELFEFGEREALPFIADYEGDTRKGKFRRLEAHIVRPLRTRGLVRVEEVGTQRRVFLTDDGRHTLRGFRYRLD